MLWTGSDAVEKSAMSLFQRLVQMGQRILLCCCREFRQTATEIRKPNIFLSFYQTDMPQRKQRPGVQIALFPRLLGAGFAEQTALRRVEIKGRAVVGAQSRQ